MFSLGMVSLELSLGINNTVNYFIITIYIMYYIITDI
jgi:hypothetical protein